MNEWAKSEAGYDGITRKIWYLFECYFEYSLSACSRPHAAPYCAAKLDIEKEYTAMSIVKTL